MLAKKLIFRVYTLQMLSYMLRDCKFGIADEKIYAKLGSYLKSRFKGNPEGMR